MIGLTSLAEIWGNDESYKGTLDAEVSSLDVKRSERYYVLSTCYAL